MMVPCVSCQSMFRLDNIRVKATGSKVRCSNCHDIFMVCPSENNTELAAIGRILKSEEAVSFPKIKHSLLDDLFEVQDRPNVMAANKETNEEPNANLVEIIDTIEDFEEVEEDEDIEYADLPDLSDIEEMIDWDEGEDSENIFLNDESKQNRSEDSNISSV